MNAIIADVDFSRIAQLGDGLLTRIDAIREIDPIIWSDSQQCWIVTGHREVVEGLKGRLPLSCAGRLSVFTNHIPQAEREARIPYLLQTLSSWIINMDPPGQSRLRQLLMKAFSRTAAEAMRPFAREVVKETLDRAGAKGDVEFMEEVARSIPPRILVRLMGLPDEFAPRAYGWAQAIDVGLASFGSPVEAMELVEQALLDMRGALAEEFAARRAAPREDFLSALMAASDGEDRLSEDEMFGICHLVLVAGHSTTANTIGLSAAALADHPEARAYLRAHPDEALNAAMELSRYIAMATTQGRLVAEDFEWKGHQLKRGQFVQLVIAGGNRDPKVWSDPESLDLARPQEQNLTFAPGVHFCIGHYLAKVQLTEFLPEFVRRFDPELLEPELHFQSPAVFRGLDRLSMRLHPRAGAQPT